MEMVLCPYCEVESSLSQIDAEDGCCPECGNMIPHSSVMSEDDDYNDDDNFSDDDVLDDDDKY